MVGNHLKFGFGPYGRKPKCATQIRCQAWETEVCYAGTMPSAWARSRRTSLVLYPSTVTLASAVAMLTAEVTFVLDALD